MRNESIQIKQIFKLIMLHFRNIFLEIITLKIHLNEYIKMKIDLHSWLHTWTILYSIVTNSR